MPWILDRHLVGQSINHPQGVAGPVAGDPAGFAGPPASSNDLVAAPSAP